MLNEGTYFDFDDDDDDAAVAWWQMGADTLFSVAKDGEAVVLMLTLVLAIFPFTSEVVEGRSKHLITSFSKHSTLALKQTFCCKSQNLPFFLAVGLFRPRRRDSLSPLVPQRTPRRRYFFVFANISFTLS